MSRASLGPLVGRTLRNTAAAAAAAPFASATLRPSASSFLLRAASSTIPPPPASSASSIPPVGHIPTTKNPSEFQAIAALKGRGPIAGKHPRRLPTTPSPKELPNPHSYFRAVALTVLVGGLSWVGFLAFVTNSERSSSSVFRQVMFVMRTSELVEEVLGDSIVLEKTWWTGGEPWVSGSISVLKGRADLSFRLRGSRQSGRVYFTSIRPTATSAFHVIRFKLILDDPVRGKEKGDEVDLRGEMQGKGYDLAEDEVPIVLGQLLAGASAPAQDGDAALPQSRVQLV